MRSSKVNKTGRAAHAQSKHHTHPGYVTRKLALCAHSPSFFPTQKSGSDRHQEALIGRVSFSLFNESGSDRPQEHGIGGGTSLRGIGLKADARV